jgi:small-conductance mechanosensitive channel
MAGLRQFALRVLLSVLWGAGGVVLPAMLADHAAYAQVAPQIDYAAWEDDAAQAEDIIAARRASTLAMEQLRTRIVDWRTKLTAAQTANQAQIETLRNQISALGPAPAEGETESEEIAQRRAALTGQLSKIQAPAIAAVEAFSRADGIIKQIDSIIRERQADALLKLSPTPLNPGNWPAGLAVLTQGLRTLSNETAEAWSNPARRTELQNNLPAILLYLVLAAVLMLRGPGFVERLTMRLQTGASLRARHVLAGLLSLGQVIVPVVGMVLLVLAISATGMTGIRSSALFNTLPYAAFAFYSARWLARWLFRPDNEDGGTGYSLLGARQVEGRFHAGMIGLILAIEMFRQAFITEVRPPLSMAAQAVWAAPNVMLVSIFLFRLGLLLRRPQLTGEMGEDVRFRNRMLSLIGTAAAGIAILAPLLAGIGYVAAADALIWPMVMTLGLFGLFILLQRFATDIYSLVARREDGREALVPVLVGFLLSLAALPLLALIWGMRTADLTEIWTRFREGVTLGETRISPTVFLTLVAVFLIGYMLTRLAQGALKSSVLPRTKMDKGVQNAVAAGVGYVGIFVAAIVAVRAAGIDLSSLAIVAGALSVGIGFGLQNIVSNFVSGIILLIERPISEGDMIEVNGQFGLVKGISVRSTWIETFDRTDVIVPNADLVSGVVTNLTRGNLTGRIILPVGVAYGTDTRKVETILHEIAEAQPLVVVDPPPAVFFTGFGADSLNFEIRAILSDVYFKMVVTSEINHEIAARFAAEGIEIPFAQRDLWIRNPETLVPGAAQRGRKAPEAKPAATAKEKPADGTVDLRTIHNDPSEGEEEADR